MYFFGKNGKNGIKQTKYAIFSEKMSILHFYFKSQSFSYHKIFSVKNILILSTNPTQKFQVRKGRKMQRKASELNRTLE